MSLSELPNIIVDFKSIKIVYYPKFIFYLYNLGSCEARKNLEGTLWIPTF